MHALQLPTARSLFIHSASLNEPAVHINFNDLFIELQSYKNASPVPPSLPHAHAHEHTHPLVVVILKIQLPYFITFDRSFKALINRDCIIICAPTSRLIYSTAVNFIRCVTTHRAASLMALKAALKETCRTAIQSHFYVSVFNTKQTAGPSPPERAH